MQKICCLSIIGLLVSLTAFAQPKPESVPAPSVDISNYPWLHPELNMLQFYSPDALSTFYKKWKQTDKEKLTVLHFGDSHCQHEAFPGTIRKRFHKVHGDAGRGLMFPYSTAKSYNSVEYISTHTGTWTSERGFTMLPKLPMGVRGMTCRTELSPASMTFDFVADVPAEYTRLKLFCKQSEKSFDLTVEIDGKHTPVIIDQTITTPYITVDIPAIRNRKMTLHVVKNDAVESEFEFYGLSLESTKETGVIYHNAGVGAARWNSLLYYELLWGQIPFIKPDVIVLDYGTNDYLYDDRIRPELENEIKTVIAKMRAAAPNASIILTSSQDLFFKKRNCRSGEPFSDMMHRIAAETKSAIFDWYWVSGGQGTMANWVNEGLAQPDYIHLSVRGYELKGNLFYDALKNTMDWMDKNADAEEFFFNVDSLKTEQRLYCKVNPQPAAVTVTNKPVATKVSPSVAATTNKVATPPAKTTVTTSAPKTTTAIVAPASTAGRVKYIHKITTGESLYSIGKKYNVTVSQLKSWNNMVRDMINAGKTLVVWVKKK